MYACMHACMSVCMYVGMYVGMYVCRYIIHAYIHIFMGNNISPYNAFKGAIESRVEAPTLCAPGAGVGARDPGLVGGRQGWAQGRAWNSRWKRNLRSGSLSDIYSMVQYNDSVVEYIYVYSIIYCIHGSSLLPPERMYYSIRCKARLSMMYFNTSAESRRPHT